MTRQDYLKKIHNEILLVMDVVDKICSDNHISYYLISGTLLGAIRHGGFIPWDDDLDVVMPRKDFDRFINICETELPEGFELKWINTDSQYWRLYAKVCNKKTVFMEQNARRECGIFIDVFPIDDCNGYSKILEFRKTIVKKIAVMISGKRNPQEFSGIKKLIVKMTSYNTLFSAAHFFMTLSNGEKKKYYTNFGSQYPIKRRTIEKNKLGRGKYIQFEDRRYVAPDYPEEVLRNIFGSDYMKLPPENKRKTHYPLYVKFSDGEEISFDIDDKRLMINDIL